MATFIEVKILLAQHFGPVASLGWGTFWQYRVPFEYEWTWGMGVGSSQQLLDLSHSNRSLQGQGFSSTHMLRTFEEILGPELTRERSGAFGPIFKATQCDPWV
jgi:hypothetical protein